jgi:hypothetical protein
MATSHSNPQVSVPTLSPHSLYVLFRYFPYLSLSLFVIYLHVLFLSHALFITNAIRSALLILLPSQKAPPPHTQTTKYTPRPSRTKKVSQ